MPDTRRLAIVGYGKMGRLVFNSPGGANAQTIAGSDLRPAVESLHAEFFAELDAALSKGACRYMPDTRRLAIVGYGKMGRLVFNSPGGANAQTIAGSDLRPAVESLHAEFFAELDAAVFERSLASHA